MRLTTCPARPMPPACRRSAAGGPQPRPAMRRPTLSTQASPSPTRGASGMDINGARPTSPRAWEEIRATLAAADVKMLTPQEVAFAAARPGTLILDCRPPAEYADGHIPGAVSIPLYRPITGMSARAVARRAVFAFFGVLNGTEANPDFWADAAAAMVGVNAVVCVCNVGGTLTPTETNKAGAQSRSLSAAYELCKIVAETRGGGEDAPAPGGLGGLLMAAAAAATGAPPTPKISVLKGGFYEWRKSGRPVEVGEDPGSSAEAAVEAAE